MASKTEGKWKWVEEIVSMADLNVDLSYQRPRSQKHVESIAANLNIAAVKAITVSRRRNGNLFIVDGQHLTSALQLKGETLVIAEVFDNLSVADEAELRLLRNHSRPDTAQEKFHARIGAKEPNAIAIMELTHEFGTKVNESPSPIVGINSVGALDAIYSDGPEFLRWTFALQRDAFTNIKGQAALGDVLKGTYWFLKVHQGEYSRKELVSRLRKTPIEDLLRKASAHRSVSRGAGWLNYYRAMLEVYNFGRKEEKRLEQRTRFSSEVPGGWSMVRGTGH